MAYHLGKAYGRLAMPLLPLLALAAINTGDDLLAVCTAPERERVACSAMVTGVAYGAIFGAGEAHQKVLCVHPGIRPADLTEAVRKYLDAHPELRSKPAPLLVYRALKEILPCPQG
jgi:hypothetical protein